MGEFNLSEERKETFDKHSFGCNHNCSDLIRKEIEEQDQKFIKIIKKSNCMCHSLLPNMICSHCNWINKLAGNKLNAN